MAVSAQQLLGAATEAGLLGEEARRTLVAEARRARRDPLEVATTRLRLAPEAFYRALARQRELPFLDAGALAPERSLLERAPAQLLQRKHVLPLRRDGEGVLVATSDPDDASTLETLRRVLGASLRLGIAEPGALQGAVRRSTAGSGGAPDAAFDGVAFLDWLLRQAWLRRASDVHLDPRDDGVGVRLRVDGRLATFGSPLPVEDAAQLLSRIKVLAGLDIAERREPQDGGFTHALDAEQRVDVRVATIPTRAGERATLRLLGVETAELTIDNLGFADEVLARFRKVLAEPQGLVLLTGPTGSGKSTTLYAALRAIRDPALNLMTVEDPVEFAIPGVAQIQVDRVGKVTFARALRSLLRHDPDVIMVGEVRDPETADVALKAALTGHLVLSSLHTNRATTAPVRLADIGCEPYLVASTLRAALAQRLVRRLCPRCRASRRAEAGELARLGGDEAALVWEPAGCPACFGTGFHGRLALTEALWVDDEVAGAVSRSVSEEELRAVAERRGFPTLGDDARAKVLAGATSLEEAVRCTSRT